MTTILELKEKMIRFYGKNEVFITPVVKFIMAFVMFSLVNSNIGYMKRISSTSVALILSLGCSVLPVNCMIFLVTAVVLADLYALSLEVCVVALLLFLVIYFMYFRFAPKHGYDVLLMPVFFHLKIPHVMPIGLGLLREVSSVFAMICGTVIWFFLNGVRENATAFSVTDEAEDNMVSKIVIALNLLVGNKELFLVLGIMVVTLIIVYIVRRMSIENAWTVAMISGVLFQTIGLIAGYMLLGITGKTVGVLLGNVAGALAALALQFLFFNLDYSRTERLQFEDDEYYYYVRAVPKAFVSGTDKKVKRFAGKGDREERLTKKQLAKEMDIDEDLLD